MVLKLFVCVGEKRTSKNGFLLPNEERKSEFFWATPFEQQQFHQQLLLVLLPSLFLRERSEGGKKRGKDK